MTFIDHSKDRFGHAPVVDLSEPGLIGFNANGAAPAPVYGVFVEKACASSPGV